MIGRIAALGVASILAWGSSYYLLAVLGQPIADEMGWSLALVVGGLSVGLLVSGLASPWVGRSIERHGGRPILAAGVLALAAGEVALGLSGDLISYFAAWVLLGLGMSASLYDAAFASIGRLLGTGARPWLTALTLWGGFASTVCWPLSAWLVETVGWRDACFVYAGLQLCIMLPAVLLGLPREAERLPPPRPPKDAPVLGPPNRALLFGILTVINMTGGMIASTWSVHLLTLLQAEGVTIAVAVALGTLVGPAQVGARVAEMTLGRRFHPLWSLAAAVLLIAVGLVMLWAGAPVLAVPVICYGAGQGIWSIARGTVPLAVFGPHGYATLMGRLALPNLLAQAAAPAVAALLLEAAGAGATWAALTGLALLNVAMVVALRVAAGKVTS